MSFRCDSLPLSTKTRGQRKRNGIFYFPSFFFGILKTKLITLYEKAMRIRKEVYCQGNLDCCAFWLYTSSFLSLSSIMMKNSPRMWVNLIKQFTNVKISWKILFLKRHSCTVDHYTLHTTSHLCAKRFVLTWKKHQCTRVGVR